MCGPPDRYRRVGPHVATRGAPALRQSLSLRLTLMGQDKTRKGK